MMAGMLPCVYKQWLGVSCPFCGLQRSCVALWHGQWQEGLLLFPALLPLLLTLALLPWARRKRPLLKAALAADLAVLVVACLMKNIGLLPS